MGDVIRLFKLLIAAAVLIPVMWMASCAAIGVGTVAAVDRAVNSELADKAISAHAEHERKRDSDEFYREADYSIQYDDYGDPM